MATRPERAKTEDRRTAARGLAVQAARIIDTRRGEDVVVLDLSGVSPVTDYFVIATGTSDRQMRAVADDIAEHGAAVGQKLWQAAGMEAGDWILLDFVDVVVHLFNAELRAYYDLELIWGEAPKVRWRRRARPEAK